MAFNGLSLVVMVNCQWLTSKHKRNINWEVLSSHYFNSFRIHVEKCIMDYVLCSFLPHNNTTCLYNEHF